MGFYFGDLGAFHWTPHLERVAHFILLPRHLKKSFRLRSTTLMASFLNIPGKKRNMDSGNARNASVCKENAKMPIQ